VTPAGFYAWLGRQESAHAKQDRCLLTESERLFLAQYGMLQSANVSGPGDNAHAESFFHTLKAELTRGVSFLTEPALRTQLSRYIRCYNTVRLLSSLGYRSPLAFERQAA
jgi:putative transposase